MTFVDVTLVKDDPGVPVELEPLMVLVPSDVVVELVLLPKLGVLKLGAENENDGEKKP